MNKLMATVFVFIITTLFITGCSTSGNQKIKNETAQSLQSKIIKNKTTKSEIVSKLGEPDTKTTLDDGNEQWRYFMSNNQFNAATFIPVVGLFTGGSQTQSKTLDIEFNGQTVSKWTFSSENNNSKTGILQ